MLINIADDSNTILDTRTMGAKGTELEVLLNGEDTTLTVDEAQKLGLINATPATVATNKEETMTNKTATVPTIRVEYMGSVMSITATRLQELGMDKPSNLALMGKELKYEEFASKANKDLGVLVIARFREVLAKKMTDATKVVAESTATKSVLVASVLDPKEVKQNDDAVQWLLGTIEFPNPIEASVLSNMRVWRNPGNKQVAYVSFGKGFYMKNRQLCQNLYRDIGAATDKLEAGEWAARMTYGICKFR